MLYETQLKVRKPLKIVFFYRCWPFLMNALAVTDSTTNSKAEATIPAASTRKSAVIRS